MNSFFECVADVILTLFVLFLLISIGKNISMHMHGHCIRNSRFTRYFDKKRMQCGASTIISTGSFFCLLKYIEKIFSLPTQDLKAILIASASLAIFVVSTMLIFFFGFQMVFATKEEILKYRFSRKKEAAST